MKLHRIGKRADWDKLKAKRRNNWQKLAVQTHGIVTPGNIISVTGFGLVLAGLGYIYHDCTIVGIFAITLGRIMDIADGMLADKTGTKSPLGEVIDASIDKLEIALALPVLVLAHVLLAWQAVVIVVLHLANVVFAGIAKARGILPHASRAGKYATTVQWAAIVLYGAAHFSGMKDVKIIADLIFCVSIALGLVAGWDYAKRAFAKA